MWMKSKVEWCGRIVGDKKFGIVGKRNGNNKEMEMKER